MVGWLNPAAATEIEPVASSDFFGPVTYAHRTPTNLVHRSIFFVCTYTTVNLLIIPNIFLYNTYSTMKRI